MKGDFTRLTFQPEKHYTSVRMQQGRLQLDSDWNEQADIQNYLYQVQVKDLIGEANGVPTSEGSATEPYRDSFKLGVTPAVEGQNNQKENDLTLAPGRLYANGTLCELESTLFDFQLDSQSAISNRVRVSTLMLDGRILEKNQWVEIYADANGNELPAKKRRLLQIKEIDRDGLILTLSDAISQSKGKMRRRLTYKTQPDFPNPELPQENGLYLAYLDVWQRHITAIDDPRIREVALTNVPDTTTRTQTVWQLKLQRLDQTVIQPFVEEFWDMMQALLSQIVVSPKNRSVQRQVKQAGEKILQDVTQLASIKDTFQADFKELIEADSRRQFRRLINTEPRRNLTALLKRLNIPISDRKKLQRELRKLLNQKTLDERGKENLQTEFRQLLERTSESTPERTPEYISEQSKEFQTLLNNATDDDSITKRSNWRRQFKRLLKQRPAPQPGQEIDPNWQSNLKQLLDSAPGSTPAKDKLRQQFDQLAAFEQQLIKIERLLVVSQSGEINPPENADTELSIQRVWDKYIADQENRRALMNARAKLGAAGNGAGYRRVENQLYRVEIHDAGIVGDQSDGAASAPKATFKWSRDNGSVVSKVERIQGNMITIRKSSQDAWADSKTGQWVEITNEELELKGKPGVMVPLIRASDTKLEFNASRIVGGSMPDQPTKVRRWDQQTDNATLLTRSADWVELESGIQVQFNQDSEYQTGDYWLLPARAATNDIEWTNDQAEENPKPLPQSPLGIHHDYCLLAIVQVKDGKFPQLSQSQETQGKEQEENQEENQEIPGLKDYRIVFPPLVRCLDTAGGTVQGNLYVNGKVGIKTDDPQSDLDVRGKITTQDLAVNGEFAANLFRGRTFQIAETPTAENPTIYGTIQAGDTDNPNQIIFNATRENTHFVFIGGRVEIGKDAPLTSAEMLQVNGTAQIQTQHGSVVLGCTQANATAPVNVLSLTIDTQTVNLGLQNNQCTFTSRNLTAYTFDREVQANAGLTTNNLGIGYSLPITAQLAVNGRVGIGTTAPTADLEVTGTTKLNSLEVNGTASATRFQGDGSALTGVVKTAGDNTLSGQLTVNNTVIATRFQGDGSALTGVVKTAGDNTLSGQLTVNNTVIATRFQGDGSGLTGVVTPGGDNTFSGTLTVNNQLTIRDQAILATRGNSNVGIGTNNPASKLTIDGNVAIGDNYSRANSITAPENGLVVEGRVGIGTFDPVSAGQSNAALTAKLEVQGTTNNASEGALNVTDQSHQSILYVRNDGSVGIGTTEPNRRLDVNGAIECNRVFIAGSGSFGKDDNNDLFLQGRNVQIEQNLTVQRKVFANEVQAGKLTQTSSRTLKEQINKLSSQEVAQVLKELNPVTFNFQADESRTTHAGFIAEDTPDLLTSADKQSIKIVDIVAVLTKALQDQQQQATELTTIIENQQSELHLLQEKVRQLEEQTATQTQLGDSTTRSIQPLSSMAPVDRSLRSSARAAIRLSPARKRSSASRWKRIFRRWFRWFRGGNE